jgi:hypothetical protein
MHHKKAPPAESDDALVTDRGKLPDLLLAFTAFHYRRSGSGVGLI